MDRVWVVISSLDDLVRVKEQLLKPDPNERKPQGRARPNVCSGLARRPVKRCWSGLLAISLGYRCRDERSASCAARACGMRGAPVRECGRVDVNTQHDVSVGL